MTVVAGIDFGSASVRASVFDVSGRCLGSGEAPIPTQRSRTDPLLATQRHEDHLQALEKAVSAALHNSGVRGDNIAALALDTTGSTVVALDDRMRPVMPYYLWSDHRAWREAEALTAAGVAALPALAWCGGRYSSEWGWAKVLHALRHAPRVKKRAVTFAEHCDVMVATLTGVQHPWQMKRSVCAAGHKWLWHDGWPDDVALSTVDPLLAGRTAAMPAQVHSSDVVAGGLCAEWAARLGLREGIPVPVGALDAHWDAVGAGCREGDAVHVLGTSGCLIAVAANATPMPGIPGVVRGSVAPSMWGIEAGLAAVGSLFEAIARRARRTLPALTAQLTSHRPGQTGLIRIPWDHGDRGIIADARLRGVCIGWQLSHSAADELFAAMEGVAMHTRLLLKHMATHGVRVERMIHGGGIPQRNPVLNRVFANVLGMPVRVPIDPVAGRGSAMFAALAAGSFESLQEAQAAMAPRCTDIEPEAGTATACDALYSRFEHLYHAFAGTARYDHAPNP